ncbi:hypothetical protein SH203_00345 [Brevundimonas sp. SH203]|uniref:hypothetical protein n=1 Tax=Brevundimonas sp. SH203 TaxID=345167 RepID=UPI0009C90C84|nr:hypothetical protein [Brevundimonas sp. SH203]GAW39959.1 hypothetical protein SH203_00345 [Brevundimonas sp. SH203]
MTENLSGSQAEKPDTKGLWETFRAIRSINEARQLLKAALFAGLIQLAQSVFDFLHLLDQPVDPNFTQDELVGYFWIFNGLILLVVAAAVWGVLSKKSRFAAAVLIVLSALSFVGALMSLNELEGTLRLAVILLGGTAVFLSIQALRAANAYRRFSASPTV